MSIDIYINLNLDSCSTSNGLSCHISCFIFTACAQATGEITPSLTSLQTGMEFSSSQGPSAQNSPNPDQTSLTHRPANRKQSSDSASNTQNAPIPDDKQGADLPMTMSASVVLTSLPRDAHQALADAEAVDTGKGKCNSWIIMFPSTIYIILEFSLGPE